MSARVAMLMAIVLLSQSATAGPDLPDAVQIGRYTQSTGTTESERDPLAVVAQIRFPREAVGTVGEALSHLLRRTGYSAQSNDMHSEQLFAMPLPDSHRQLGPYQVHTIARLLIGERYDICLDRLTRTVGVRVASGTPCPQEDQP